MELYERIALVAKEKYPQLKDFAAAMGVSCPYLCNLINGKTSIGAKPLIWIIENHPDIDARWLITGKGYMYGNEENVILDSIRKVFEIEQYICVMDDKDVHHFLNYMRNIDVEFPKNKIEEYKDVYNARFGSREEMIKNAMKLNLDKVKNGHQNT